MKNWRAFMQATQAGDNQTHYRNDAKDISGHNTEYVDYRWG